MTEQNKRISNSWDMVIHIPVHTFYPFGSGTQLVEAIGKKITRFI